jgi:hypothetical protein
VCNRLLVILPSPSFFGIWEGNGGRKRGRVRKRLEKLESERISFTGLPLFINDLFYSSTLISPEIAFLNTLYLNWQLPL